MFFALFCFLFFVCVSLSELWRLLIKAFWQADKFRGPKVLQVTSFYKPKSNDQLSDLLLRCCCIPPLQEEKDLVRTLPCCVVFGCSLGIYSGSLQQLKDITLILQRISVTYNGWMYTEYVMTKHINALKSISLLSS